jgi:hypothetical protein
VCVGDARVYISAVSACGARGMNSDERNDRRLEKIITVSTVSYGKLLFCHRASPLQALMCRMLRADSPAQEKWTWATGLFGLGGIFIVVAFGLCVIGLCFYGGSLIDPTCAVRARCPNLIQVDRWGVAVHMVLILLFVSSVYLWRKSDDLDSAKGLKLILIGCLFVGVAMGFGLMAALIRMEVDLMMRSLDCRLAMAELNFEDLKDGELPPNSHADLVDLGRLLSDMGIVCSVGYVLCIGAVLLRWWPRPGLNGQ